MRFNLNRQVRVKLTNVGLRMLREHNARQAAWFAENVPTHDFVGHIVNDDGVWTEQACVVFSILGRWIKFGKKEPFSMDIELEPFEDEGKP